MDEQKYIQYVKDMAEMYRSEFGEDGRYQDVMDYVAYLKKRLTPRAGGLAHAPEGGQSPASEITGESANR